MLAWKRPKSLRDQLVKAKIPDQIQRSQREVHGMKKCNRPNCNTCPYVKTSKQIVSYNTGKIVSINSSNSCDSSGIIYYIKCKRCNQEYIGQTGRTLSKRFGEHRGYVNNKTNDPTGIHFNLPGHRLSDMEVSILEKVHSKDKVTRETRESLYIRDFQTEVNGMNIKK